MSSSGPSLKWDAKFRRCFLASFSAHLFIHKVPGFFGADYFRVMSKVQKTPWIIAFWLLGLQVAWVYAIELNVIIFVTFRRKRGLYFWSVLVSSWSLSIHALGFILKFLAGTTWLLSITLVTTRWFAMVTGQAFVLYSRLHLVVRNRRTLHYVLCLNLFNAMALHVPTVIFTYGSNSSSADISVWAKQFNVMERIRLSGFFIQETMISAIYVQSTVKMLGSICHSLDKESDGQAYSHQFNLYHHGYCLDLSGICQ
ncbi:hypothetical protein MMC22_006182 [Lobaria immixta]|nr:hypothetical protein [Lobaria immixta]